MKKLYLSLLLFAVSCKVNPATHSNGPAGFSELEQEYLFQNKALTQNYLERKLRYWIANDGVRLVKEIEFARAKKEAVPFRALVTDKPALLNDINGVFEVITEREKNPPFRLFLDGPGEKISCQEHYENGSTTDGIYTIDPDGPENGVEPFEVYCNMTDQDGGWTLVAYHADGVMPVEKNLVDRTAYGVLPADRWIAVRSTLSTGMMFIDENNKVSRISKNKLETANCKNIYSSTNLLNGAYIMHNEIGCNGVNTDYTIIRLLNGSINGAALYQYSAMKFDLWPYGTSNISYYNQNKLEYYLK